MPQFAYAATLGELDPFRVIATSRPLHPPLTELVNGTMFVSEGSGGSRFQTSFVGRETELAQISALLLAHRSSLITITGQGGVGKTRLATHLAMTMGVDHSIRSVLVSLSEIHEHSHVVQAVATSLGIGDQGAHSQLEQVVDSLNSRETLLILDNFEHVLEASPVLSHLAIACPSTRFLITSRFPLGIDSEIEHILQPLNEQAAIQLFLDRAQVLLPVPAKSMWNSTSIATLCQRLDGLPLAIELAASKVAVLSPDDLVIQLQQSYSLLADGFRDQPDRLRTMRNAIMWSFNLLNSTEQLHWQFLSVFAGDLHSSLLDSLIVRGMIDQANLDSLVSKSILSRRGVVDGRPVLFMLQTIRDFGLEMLQESGRESTSRNIHLDVFSELTRAAEPHLTGPNQMSWFSRLEQELPNIRSALDFALGHAPSQALRMVGQLARFWDHHNHVREGRNWIRAALDATDASDYAEDRAKAAWAAGVLSLHTGDYELARDLLVTSENAAACIQSTYWLGFALNGLGSAFLHLGQLDEARRCHERALQNLELAADLDGIAAAKGNIGFTALIQGDIDAAVSRTGQSLNLYRSMGSTHGEASMLGTFGRALVEQRQLPAARVALLEGLRLSLLLEHSWYTIVVLGGLASVAALSGEGARALRLFTAMDFLLKQEGIVLSPFDRSTWDRYRHVARETLEGEGLVKRFYSVETFELSAVIDAEFELSVGESPPPAAVTSLDLTPREKQVLRLIVAGESDRLIAEHLGISPRTVNYHVSNVLGKLQVPTRTAAIAYVTRLQLDL